MGPLCAFCRETSRVLSSGLRAGLVQNQIPDRGRDETNQAENHQGTGKPHRGNNDNTTGSRQMLSASPSATVASR